MHASFVFLLWRIKLSTRPRSRILGDRGCDQTLTCPIMVGTHHRHDTVMDLAGTGHGHGSSPVYHADVRLCPCGHPGLVPDETKIPLTPTSERQTTARTPAALGLEGARRITARAHVIPSRGGLMTPPCRAARPPLRRRGLPSSSLPSASCATA